MMPIIGIDFDNTIVCYDDVFYNVAIEQGLIATDFPRSKEKIRNFLRQCGKEDIWTTMQGYVYGPRMALARPFPDITDFIKEAVAKQIQIYIISHKTRYPYAGEQYDLHASAYEWLAAQQFFAAKHLGLTPDQVFFLETKRSKCEQIAKLGCTHFIDDLPEFLADEYFPKTVKKILFSALEQTQEELCDYKRFASWQGIRQHFFAKELTHE